MHLRETAQKLAPLVRILARVEAGLQGRHHAAPVEASEVHGLEHLGRPGAVVSLLHQRLEGGDRGRVLRVDRQGRRVLVERPVDLVRPLLEHVAERVMQRRLAVAGDARRGDLAVVEGHQVLPALGLRVQTLQGGDRLGVEPEIEDLFVDGDRRAGIAELLVAQTRLLEEELPAIRVALGDVLRTTVRQ